MVCPLSPSYSFGKEFQSGPVAEEREWHRLPLEIEMPESKAVVAQKGWKKAEGGLMEKLGKDFDSKMMLNGEFARRASISKMATLWAGSHHGRGLNPSRGTVAVGAQVLEVAIRRFGRH